MEEIVQFCNFTYHLRCHVYYPNHLEISKLGDESTNAILDCMHFDGLVRLHVLSHQVQSKFAKHSRICILSPARSGNNSNTRCTIGAFITTGVTFPRNRSAVVSVCNGQHEGLWLGDTKQRAYDVATFVTRCSGMSLKFAPQYSLLQVPTLCREALQLPSYCRYPHADNLEVLSIYSLHRHLYTRLA